MNLEGFLYLVLLHCVKRVFGVILARIFPHSDKIRRDFSVLSISPYSARMRENMDQSNSKYGRFSRSVRLKDKLNFSLESFWQSFTSLLL